MEYTLVKPDASFIAEDDSVQVFFPNFMPEVLKSKFQRGQRKLTTAAMLRLTLIDIADKYDPTFEVYRQFAPVNYEGLPFNSDEEYSQIIVRIIKEIRPNIIDAAIMQQIREAPRGTKLIYFVAEDLIHTKAFMDAKIPMKASQNTKSPQGKKNKGYNRIIQNNTALLPQNEEIENG